MKKILQSAVATIGLGLTSAAGAVPVTFDLANSSSVSIDFDGGFLCNLTGCGASVALSPNLGSSSTTLSAGQSWTFDFFRINFYGLGGGSGDIQASLTFDAPLGADPAAGGGVGSFFTSFILSAGNLFWTSQPGQFELGDGTTYSVFFQNLHGLTIGQTANVSASLTLHNEPNAVVPVVGVPEPGALGLLGLGLVGIGCAVRRRRVAPA